jgi:hypothetical protein
MGEMKWKTRKEANRIKMRREVDNQKNERKIRKDLLSISVASSHNWTLRWG